MIGKPNIEYVQTDQLVATSYVKNSKAIGFLWGLFSVCFAIISIVVFVQPQWIGSDSTLSYFGLWKHCRSTTDSWICQGRLDDFGSILNPSFRCATVFVGLGCLVSILAVFGLILFLCAPPPVGFNIVSWLITIAACFQIIGILIFPVGWDHPSVNSICGNNSKMFALGACDLRWAYLLAIIGALDGIILAALGFTLATRHIKLRECNSRLQSTSGTSRPLCRSVVESTTVPSLSAYSGVKNHSIATPYFVPIDGDKHANAATYFQL